MAPWLACCAAREAETGADEGHLVCALPWRPPPTATRGVDSLDEVFFDCAETDDEFATLRASGAPRGGHAAASGAGGHAASAPDGASLPPWAAPPAGPAGHDEAHGRRCSEASEASGGGGGGARSDCCTDLRDCTDLAAARDVLESTHECWSQRFMGIRKTPELEWATLSTARRMLKANIGDVQKAIDMFVQALELRARDRQLYQNLTCDARCDMRIVGRDVLGHPVVYMCAGSQTEPLRAIRDQFVVTFEAACKLTSDMGTLYFIVDMHGARPYLNMDISAIKDIADTLGTVYAERIFRITIVDFSRTAQAVWYMMKPLMSQATRQKFAFVSLAQARDSCRADMSDYFYERFDSTFAINRDRSRTPEERALHARRTTMCDVPLGPPLN